MTNPDRTRLIQEYATGPERFRAALTNVPHAAVQWRPAPSKWTVHEIVLHCADSETNAHMRLRYLLAEPEPRILGYDQDRWAKVLEYHQLPLEPALDTIAAVRANTVPLLERLHGTEWERTGHHTERGRYSVADWLETYAVHLDVHVAQIARTVLAYRAATGRV